MIGKERIYNYSLLFVIFICAIFSCKSGEAQSDLMVIRNVYKSVNANISKCLESEDPCGLYLASWTLNKEDEPWRVIGINTQTIDFWFYENELTQSYVPRKIVSHAKVSDYMIYEEWLFNESGEFIFYYKKDGSLDSLESEKRYYFKRDTIFHTIPNMSVDHHDAELMSIREEKDKLLKTLQYFIEINK